VKLLEFLNFGARIARLESALSLEREARARSEAFIAETLEERNILMGEIHHRVKNNLQIIVSLLRLQAGDAAEEATKTALGRAVNRVQAISMAHERLYKSSDFSAAVASSYFRDLAAFLRSALNDEGGADVEYILDADPLPLDPDRCISCGLIVNELVTNAVKHAFPQDGSGKPWRKKRVIIAFGADGEDYVLTVADNGSGMQPESLGGKPDSLGMRMVNSLCRQMRGSLDASYSGGMVFRLRFKAAVQEAPVRKVSALRRIRQAIGRLPEEDRELATRYYMDGRSVAELAASPPMGGNSPGSEPAQVKARLQGLRSRILNELLSAAGKAGEEDKG
jgi:two-component sensor histidine kinase